LPDWAVPADAPEQGLPGAGAGAGAGAFPWPGIQLLTAAAAWFPAAGTVPANACPGPECI